MGPSFPWARSMNLAKADRPRERDDLDAARSRAPEGRRGGRDRGTGGVDVVDEEHPRGRAHPPARDERAGDVAAAGCVREAALRLRGPRSLEERLGRELPPASELARHARG